jgi:hypothetical protein
MPAVGVALIGLAASAAATSVLTGAVIAGITISAGVATFVGGLVGLVVSTGLSLLLNKAPSVARADVQAADRKQAVRSGIAPRNIVYGRALVAGPVVFMGSEGEYNEWMHVVMPLAGHPVHAFTAIRLNGFIIPVAAYSAGAGGTAGSGVGGVGGLAVRLYAKIRAGTEQGTIGAGDLSTTWYPDAELARDAVMRIDLWDGTQTVASAALIAELPTEWDSDKVMTGLPYIHLRLRFSNDVFGGGFQNLSVELLGKKLWDPRDDSTAYSANAALAALDYLISDYGLGVPSGEIDTDIVAAAANIADEMVAVDEAETSFEARYTVNGSYKLDQAPIDIMEALLAGWGTCTYVQGLYRIHAAASEASTLSIGPGDFAGPVELVRNHPRRGQFNAVTGTYIDPAQGWEAIAFPKVVSSAALAADGEEIPVSLDLPFVLSAYYAQRLARLRLLTHRAAGFQVRAALKYSALRMAIWDTVDVTLPEFGLDEDPFRVTSWQFDPVSGLVNVVLQADDPNAYAWDATDAEEPILSPVTSLVSPLTVPEGEEPTVTPDWQTGADGTVIPRLLVAWDADAPTPYVTATEIQWRNDTADDAYTARILPRPTASTLIAPIRATDDYDIRLRYHAGVVRGAWSPVVTITGEGTETVTPSGPSGAAVTAILGGYRVTFTKATAADIAATEIGEDVHPYGTGLAEVAYVAETTGDIHVRMVASGDYAARRVYLRSRNTAGQRSAWTLIDTVTPQTAGTVDLAADAVTSIVTDAAIVTFVPASTAWEDTDVAVTVTVATGEKVVLWMTARLEELIDSTPTGGGAEGGQESGE